MARTDSQKRYTKNNKEKVNTYKRKHYQDTKHEIDSKEYQHAQRLKTRYGLTPQDLDQMVEAQGNCCAICGVSFESRKMNIDHDHVTGGVRMLLCSRCNTGLAYIEDDTYLLDSLEYLRQHNKS